MSAKHTPGPWHRNIRADGKYPVVFAGRNTHVATVSQQKSGDETESNIDLIAAAPDLLAMLKRCIKHVPESAVAGELIMTTAIDECRIRTLAEKLIAKAEGGGK